MAYVGCVAGAVLIDTYVTDLTAAGFSAVQVVDTQKDLNAYGEVEGQSACCSPSMAPADAGCGGLTVIDPACTPAPQTNAIHGGFTELLKKFDINAYAASVQVYAIKQKD
jgi:hypothetical protein